MCVFLSRSSVFRGSAVCLYTMNDIRRAFLGPFAHKEGPNYQWVPFQGKVPYPRPGMVSSSFYWDAIARSLDLLILDRMELVCQTTIKLQRILFYTFLYPLVSVPVRRLEVLSLLKASQITWSSLHVITRWCTTQWRRSVVVHSSCVRECSTASHRSLWIESMLQTATTMSCSLEQVNTLRAFLDQNGVIS